MQPGREEGREESEKSEAFGSRATRNETKRTNWVEIKRCRGVVEAVGVHAERSKYQPVVAQNGPKTNSKTTTVK